MPEYIGVIGLEVHIQLKTRSKLFCGCSAEFDAKPNTCVCPVCLGMPGALPVLNRRAVEYALRLCAAVGAAINHKSEFARKNYFYPDLPKGYQISQFERPLARGGTVDITNSNGQSKSVYITEIHLEEEAGKSFHDRDAESSYIDFNRCGIPLIEIVTEPDMNTAYEADAFLHKIKQLAEYLDITTGNMQEGALRWDVNVSVRKSDEIKLNPRHEIKNINSFRFARKAIEHEINAQIEQLQAGKVITRQTMLYNESLGITEPMREKEGAADYRYFPEPDLQPLVIAPEWLNCIKKDMPELPDMKFQRFKKQYGLRDDQARNLIADKALADFYEHVAGLINNPTISANWVINELPAEIKAEPAILSVSFAERLAELIDLIQNDIISPATGKEILAEILDSEQSPEEIIKIRNLGQISDEAELLAIIEKVLSENEDNIKMYFSGKTGLFGYFIGQVMELTGGKAKPKMVSGLLLEALAKIKDGNA